VSPSAFFQTNTKGAEILYDKVGEWSGARSEADAPPGEQKFRFLLDICCGTGTIGLSLAKYVHLVVGVDIEPQAIEDAKKNAALNNISNFKYYASKAETVMGPMIATCGHQSVIGIVFVFLLPFSLYFLFHRCFLTSCLVDQHEK
jgi:tRNA (uracil-5-)-methyltransferase